MEIGQNQYDILIQAITEYTAKLGEITNKIEKIKLSYITLLLRKNK